MPDLRNIKHQTSNLKRPPIFKFLCEPFASSRLRGKFFHSVLKLLVGLATAVFTA